ncbi:hypothetical protein DFJ63DRAFT_214289 [Scheffersomyces coipomensis]|uniref:uncharacterized protein n=1 Tax=Scheffersomyces coipomensis TaxID=1788519 RepID=UPI00315C60D3
MKRGFDGLLVENISPTPSIVDFNQFIQDFSSSPPSPNSLRLKRKPIKRYTTKTPPSTLILSHQSEALSDPIKHIFHQISSTHTRNLNQMDIDYSSNNNTNLRFVFFLGVQGKEYIDIIQHKFISMINTTSSTNSQILFISSNLPQLTFPISTNNQCLQLVNSFKIKDPLGGGLYPLDYLYVIDQNDLIRCKIPIIINSNSNRLMNKSSLRNRNLGGLSNHLNFGVELEQLPGFIEEYMAYFH